MAYQGNRRDSVVSVCVVLFTFVWWHVNHDRNNWLPVFAILIVPSVITGVYAPLGVSRAFTPHRAGPHGISHSNGL